MTDRLSALQALLAANREEAPITARNTPPTNTPPATRGTDARQGVAEVEPGTASLLARLISQLPAAGQLPWSVQFLPCCAAEHAGGIARTIACAATLLLGRTLLLHALVHPRSVLAADWHQAPMPDAFLPGLYHHQIGAAWSDFATPTAPDLLAGQVADAGRYRFVVLDSAAPSAGGSALALAPLCGGSVLVVLAGITKLAMVRAAASDLTSAGAHLLGTILFDPAKARA
jgi:hypothetical protein